MWIFGKSIENKPIYIKIKLASFGPLNIVRVISFHFAKDVLKYPFKEKKEERADDEDDCKDA